MFLFAETMEYIFRVSPMICQRVYVPKTVKVFLDKISLVFVVFLHFFTVFCVFSLRFSGFVESFNQIRTQRKQLRMFFEFYRSALPVFLLFSICFFLLHFHAVFPALYNNLCKKATLNLVTLVSTKTGDQK